jgi:ATP-binding cassette subfamily F protein 3
VADLTVGYDSIPVVNDIQFELTRSDRVGLIGPNGCGKTTLLKTLGGLLEPISGEITVGNNVDVAYFDQELSNIDPENDVISELWEVDPLAESGRLRSFLARFEFTGDDVFKPVGFLSGGEKTKLSLAKILYRPANLMIFDEPTNHLDIGSIEALEDGLANYTGTLLIVSHDRDFLDKVVNKVFEIESGFLYSYLGNYSDYIEKKDRRSNGQKDIDEEKKASYQRFREQSRQRSRYRKRLMQINEDIESLEQQWSQLEKEALTIDGADWQRLAALRDQRRELEEQILGLYIEKEKMESQPPDEA